MKAYLLLLLALLGSVFADKKVCTYVSSDGKYSYSLRPLMRTSGIPYSYSKSNATYYFNFCDDLDDLTADSTITCPPDSSVCLHTGNNWINLGEADSKSTIWSDSSYGSDKGIEFIYGNGQSCKESPNTQYKTLFRMNCSKTELMTVVDASTNGCYTIITIQSKIACPMNSGNHTHDDDDDMEYHSSTISIFWILACCCCSCLLVVCCVRVCRNHRRRCGTPQCRRNCSKTGDYTAIEFQTFSESQQPVSPVPVAPEQPQSMPPYFVMYPPQSHPNQQQFMYAPPMYMMPPQSPVVGNKQAQIQNDEQLARELQEQLNKE